MKQHNESDAFAVQVLVPHMRRGAIKAARMWGDGVGVRSSSRVG